MMVYIALVSIVLMTTGLLIENIITGGPLRILNYNKEQCLFALGSGALNIGGLFFKIVAYQNERSGFITLLGYIGLIYAFWATYLSSTRRS